MTWNAFATYTPTTVSELRAWFEDTVMVNTVGFSKQAVSGGSASTTWWEVEIDCFNFSTLVQKFNLDWTTYCTYSFDTNGTGHATGDILDHYDSRTLVVNQPYTWWVSTENSSAFLVTQGADTVFYWPGFRSGHNKIHAYGVNGDTDRQTEIGMWLSHDGFGYHWMMKGRPLDLAKINDTSTNDPVGPLASPFYDDPGSASFGTDLHKEAVLYSNSWFGAGTNHESSTNADPDNSTYYLGYQGNVVMINQPDIQHWIPASVTNYMVGGWSTNGAKVVFDGVNYYWATSAGESYHGLWFDMGTTDQTL